MNKRNCDWQYFDGENSSVGCESQMHIKTEKSLVVFNLTEVGAASQI